MGFSFDFSDADGFEWDFLGGSDNRRAGGVEVDNGSADAFDGAYDLVVNGIIVDPETAVRQAGRLQFETAPFAIDADADAGPGEQTVLVTRDVFVNDGAAGSDLGFVRFLETFTNLSDQTATLSIRIESNMGSDSFTARVKAREAEGLPIGWATDDVFPGERSGSDPIVAHVWGDGRPGSLRDEGLGATTIAGDNLTVAFSLDLAPGETARLMHFAAQTQDADAVDPLLDAFVDLARTPVFNPLLSGLDPAARATIVNYDAAEKSDDFRMFGAEGRFVGFGPTSGSVRFGTPESFGWLQASGSANTLVSAEFDPVARTADFEWTDPDGNTYRLGWFAPADADWVRMHMEFENAGDVGTGTVFGLDAFGEVTFGNAFLPLRRLVHTADDGGSPNRWVTDDLNAETLVSGFGGFQGVTFGDETMPTLDIEPTDANANAADARSVVGGETAGWLAYIVSDDRLADVVATVEALTQPGPAALAGLSREALRNLVNFDLGEGDRLARQRGSGEADALEAGQDAAARLLGFRGDDELTGGRFDDRLQGGAGEDVLLGLAGDDTLRGDVGGDLLFGGRGADVLDGAGSADLVRGGGGLDRMRGGGGDDTLRGGAGIDTIADGRGADLMLGGAGRDRFEMARDGTLDRIRGFEDGRDQIALVGVRFRDLEIEDRGQGVRVRAGGDTLIVEGPGLTAADLERSDFAFVL